MKEDNEEHEDWDISKADWLYIIKWGLIVGIGLLSVAYAAVKLLKQFY